MDAQSDQCHCYLLSYKRKVNQNVQDTGASGRYMCLVTTIIDKDTK